MRLVALALPLALLACTGGAPGSPGGPDATVESDLPDGGLCLFCADADEDAPLAVKVSERLVQVCGQITECHGSGAGGMSIAPDDPFKTIVNVTSSEAAPMLRVKPGDPLNSYVYIKLRCEGGIAGGGCMPGGGNAGNPQIAQIFLEWIEAGAPDH
jgi:hypothetical protein